MRRSGNRRGAGTLLRAMTRRRLRADSVREWSYGRCVPSPIPPRERHVFMVGAGLSCALGLPNTASLVATVLDAYETEAPLAS